MKKISLIVIIMACLVMLSSCGNKSKKIYVGMPYEDYLKLMKKESVLELCSYVFIKDGNNNVVVKFDADSEKVETIRFFTKKSVSSEDFSTITSGMNMFEVVEKVGLPFRSITFGLTTLDFLAEHNNIYRIEFNEEMIVQSVNKITKK